MREGRCREIGNAEVKAVRDARPGIFFRFVATGFDAPNEVFRVKVCALLRGVSGFSDHSVPRRQPVISLKAIHESTKLTHSIRSGG
jgi:hypothetical protein